MGANNVLKIKSQIPYGKQQIFSDDVEAVVRVLNSDYLTQGPCIEKFEYAIAQYCQVKYAVAFSSGTAALHGACFAAGVGNGDEVITSPLTFAASANCVLYCGGKPVFADIKSDIPLIDPKQIFLKITDRTKAVIPVDYSGMPADYHEINILVRKHKLIVIADAAHSFGATYKDKKVGSLADMTVFSFHPVKLITTGEGGMVVTNNQKFYERLLLFRNHGITKDPRLLKRKSEGPWYYEMQELGFNYRLTDIQAALGLMQLKKINRFLVRRTEIASVYTNFLKNEINIRSLSVSNDRTSAWHLYPIQLQGKLRNLRKDIVNLLHKRGVMVQIHYIPVHLHPFYHEQFGFKKGDFPNAEAFYEGEISLPIFPKLKTREQFWVLKTLKNVLTSFSSLSKH